MALINWFVSIFNFAAKEETVQSVIEEIDDAIFVGDFVAAKSILEQASVKFGLRNLKLLAPTYGASIHVTRHGNLIAINYCSQAGNFVVVV